MNNHNSSTLLFLLSLGSTPLGAGCVGDDRGATATMPSTDTDDGDTDGAGASETDGAGLEVDCAASARNLVMCDSAYDYEENARSCEQFTHWLDTAYADSCVGAFARYHECIAALPCESLDDGDSACSIEYPQLECDEPTPPSVCLSYGAARSACDPDVVDVAVVAEVCLEYIWLGTFFDGLPCAESTEDYFACLSALSCAELTAVEALEVPDPCAGVLTCVDPPPPAPSY